MTGLLVSVRSAAEAELAFAGGADVIDIKEPRRGALGPAEPQVWREVQALISGRAVVSAALGELHSDSILDFASSAAGLAYAKIGLSDWRRRNDSARKWHAARLALPTGVGAVPVVYADVEASGWESFAAAAIATIALARVSQSPLLVIDTFQKRGRTLLDFTDLALLAELSHYSAEHKVRFVLAGSLNEEAIERLLPLAPAYIGVRGAACLGARDETIDLARVKSLARLVHGGREKPQM
jgi:uncharacterized protein (UPF0264 family)